MKNYKRKHVDTEKYYSNLVVYIHNNPVKHGFVEHQLEYPWTSYLLIKEEKDSFVNTQDVLDLFDGVENYEYVHQQELDEEEIAHLIVE